MNVVIKSMPKEERPRERLLNNSASVLSNEELLAIILKTGTKEENVKVLAQNVLNKVKNIQDLRNINKESLMEIKGIKEAKAVEILASIELGKRAFLKEEDNKETVFNSSIDIFNFNKYIFLDLKQEQFYVLYLNNKNKLIERKLLFMGTINKSIVHPREIFKNAYLLSASSIICMHNHPSGDVRPSKEDIFLTNNLVEIGKMQGINVLDHIIFGHDTYYSFNDNGMIKR